MAPAETTAIREIAGDVRELTESVSKLRIEVRESIINATNDRQKAAEVRLAVFGMDGHHDMPGLKGEMIGVKKDLKDHDEDLAAIHEKYRAGLSKAWMLVVALAGAGLGAACKFGFDLIERLLK